MSSPNSTVERHLLTVQQWALQPPPSCYLWQPWIRELVTRDRQGDVLVDCLLALLSDPPESCMIPLVMIKWVISTSPVTLRRNTLSRAVQAVKDLASAPEPLGSLALSALSLLRTELASPGREHASAGYLGIIICGLGHAMASSIAQRLGYSSAERWLSDTQRQHVAPPAFDVLLPPEVKVLRWSCLLNLEWRQPGKWADVLLSTPPALSSASAAQMLAHWLKTSQETEHSVARSLAA